MNPDFLQWANRVKIQTELYLEQYLITDDTAPTRLHQAMRYATLNGGKRIRPQLVIAAAQLGEINQQALDQAVVAIELIHCYSLVHDDMPEMDNDKLRHGKPTCHIEYDQATALLVGDALQTRAFDVLAMDNTLPLQQRMQSIKLLAKAAGSLGMAGGQAMDLASTGLSIDLQQLITMHRLKTGALIETAVSLGLLTSNNFDYNHLAQLQHYAQALGLAFQVIDDVLDYQSDTATLGKTARKDQLNNKPTFVSLMGIEKAQNYALDLVEQAKSSLDSFGDETLRLRQIADFVVKRQH